MDSGVSLDEFANPAAASLLEGAIRAIAHSHDGDPSSWAEKYGAAVDNSLFSMHRYCWCDEETCAWCGPEERPNFLHKGSNLSVWWYKYIGRGMRVNREPSLREISSILEECLPPSP
jgi:hypothetical protein